MEPETRASISLQIDLLFEMEHCVPSRAALRAWTRLGNNRYCHHNNYPVGARGRRLAGLAGRIRPMLDRPK